MTEANRLDGLDSAARAIEPMDSTYATRDGKSLHVRHWPVPEPSALGRGGIVVLHGIQSHAGWYDGLGRRLAAAGYAAWFPDRRGSGRNTEDRGHVSSPGQLLDDVRRAIALAREGLSPGQPLLIAGISWGGKLAALAATEEDLGLDALVLITPGLFALRGPSRSERRQIALAALTKPRRRFPIPLNDPELFTAVPEHQRFIAQDPLTLRDATARFFATSARLDLRVRFRSQRIRIPSLLMLAGNDRIIDNDRTRAWFERLPIPEGRRAVVVDPDAQHTLEFEPDPARYARELTGWLDRTLPIGDNRIA